VTATLSGPSGTTSGTYTWPQQGGNKADDVGYAYGENGATVNYPGESWPSTKAVLSRPDGTRPPRPALLKARGRRTLPRAARVPP
jgi:hypothetical protein